MNIKTYESRKLLLVKFSKEKVKKKCIIIGKLFFDIKSDGYFVTKKSI